MLYHKIIIQFSICNIISCHILWYLWWILI
jgi:hypothetical protein